MLLHDEEFVSTDRRGRPEISGIHDAQLSKLSVDFGHTLSFETLGVQDERRTFVLDGLHLLNIDGHWDGVIIGSIFVWHIRDELEGASADDVSRAWRALLAGRIDPGGEIAEIERLRRKYDKLSLVSVSCSYGGELHALCRDVLIDGRRTVAA